MQAFKLEGFLNYNQEKCFMWTYPYCTLPLWVFDNTDPSWPIHFGKVMIFYPWCWVMWDHSNNYNDWGWFWGKIQTTKYSQAWLYAKKWVFGVVSTTGSSMAKCNNLNQYLNNFDKFWNWLWLSECFQGCRFWSKLISFCSNNLLWPEK